MWTGPDSLKPKMMGSLTVHASDYRVSRWLQRTITSSTMNAKDSVAIAIDPFTRNAGRPMMMPTTPDKRRHESRQKRHATGLQHRRRIPRHRKKSSMAEQSCAI